MSFHEKSAWGSLVIVLLALVGYVGALAGAQAWDSPGETGILLLAVTVAIVIAEVGYHTLIAIPLARAPDEGEADERDRLVSWRAESCGGLVLGGFVVAAIAYIVGRELLFPAQPGIYAAHLLFQGLACAAVVTDVYRIFLYRKGV